MPLEKQKKPAIAIKINANELQDELDKIVKDSNHKIKHSKILKKSDDTATKVSPKIREQFEQYIIANIIKQYINNFEVIKIDLSDYDEPLQYELQKEILEDFKNKSLIKDFEIKEGIKIIPIPEEPTDIEKEIDPLWFDGHQKELEHYHEHYAPMNGEPYHEATIKKEEVDISRLEKLRKKFLKKTDYTANESLNKQARKRKKINPPLPENTAWEDITIKISSNGQDFDVFVKNEFFVKSNYEKLGCFKDNTKNKSSDEQWKFLNKLSVYKGKFQDTQNEKYRQQKKKLSKNLKFYFDINDDPFYSARIDSTYATKFKIEPEPILRGTGEVWNTVDEKFDDLKESYDEAIASIL